MAAYAPIKIQHSPIVSWPSLAQANYVGAQSVAGRRGSLPAFGDTNSYFIAKTGDDGAAGTGAAPFKTFGKPFASAAAGKLLDYSGNSRTLAEVGTVPQPVWPCYPMPPSGDYYAGPFTDSNYFTAPASLRTALTGLTAYTIGMYFQARTFAAASTDLIDMRNAGALITLTVVNTGAIQFNLNGTATTSSTGLVVPGKWYYIALKVDPTLSGMGMSKQVLLGETPETATTIIATNQTFTMGAATSLWIGRNQAAGSRFFDGYISRLFFEGAARTSFPTRLYSTGTTITPGIIAAYYFQTLPVVISAPKDYVTIQDSGSYNDAMQCNYPYELTSATNLGIYSADGAAPTISRTRGATAGTYGANNSARALYGVPDYYVSKAGSDSAGGTTPATAFLTIQKALTTIGSASKTVEILDGGAYVENLTYNAGANTVRVQASLGVAPILIPATTTTYHITTGSNSNAHFYGCIFDEKLAGSLITGDGSGSSSNSFTDCTMSNGVRISIERITLTSCIIRDFTNFGAAPYVVANNCYFEYHDNPTRSFNISATDCTFNGAIIEQYTYSDRPSLVMHRCLFKDSSLIMYPSASTSSYVMAYCEVDGGQVDLLDAGITISPNIVCLIYGNIIKAHGLTTGLAVTRTTSTRHDVGVYNNVVMGAQTNYKLTGTATGVSLYNNTSIGATTIGLNGGPTKACVGFLDSGSALVGGAYYTGGIVPTQSKEGEVLAAAPGSENATLSAEDGGIFGVSIIKDIGMDYGLLTLQLPNVTLNGLTLDGPMNGEGGVSAEDGCLTLTMAYCSLSGLGTYGIKTSDNASITNCYLSSLNGHGIKNRRTGAILSRNVVANCPGAGFLNYGAGASNSYMSTYGCQYGEYDSSSSVATITGCIFASSGAYDYSGNSTLNYVCAGTLDAVVGRAPVIGPGLVRQDPLYMAVADGDLRLQAKAWGYYYDSPACSLSTGQAKDYGAFDVTYGSSSTTYTTIDFGTTDWRNPDTIQRSNLSIKLAEGDREDGSIYSVYATNKKEWVMEWRSNLSDMPAAQLAALLVLFTSFTNAISVDFGDGRGWTPCYFARQQGFEYSELTGNYADDTTPTPLRTFTIREA